MIQRILRGSIDQEQEMRGTTEWSLRQQGIRVRAERNTRFQSKVPRECAFYEKCVQSKSRRTGRREGKKDTDQSLPARPTARAST